MTGPDSEGLQALPASMVPSAGSIDAISNYDPDERAPVVPSVGAVPVEVPERQAAIGAVHLAHEQLGYEADEGKVRPDEEMDAFIADAVLLAAAPLIAARVEADGRHRAEREQRWATQHLHAVMAMLIGCTVDGLVDQMWMDPHGQYEITDTLASLRAQIAAAGSAVPVATPATMDERLTAYLDARGISLTAGCLPGQAAYVEEEARELVEAAESNDWTAARLEVADVAHALAGTARELGTTVEACMDEKLEADRGRGNARPKARPVATPTGPVDEVKCPDCEATIRAQMSDRPASRTDLPVRLARDTLDGGWVAEFMPMPGVQSQGETIPDALRGLADALAESIEAIMAAVHAPAEQDGQQ